MKELLPLLVSLHKVLTSSPALKDNSDPTISAFKVTNVTFQKRKHQIYLFIRVLFLGAVVPRVYSSSADFLRIAYNRSFENGHKRNRQR